MLETKFEGEDLPHRLMWAIVSEHAELARQRQRDWSQPALVAMVFAFHAAEAYLNYVGLKIAPEIWENEREHFKKSGFPGKLREVMERVELTWAPGRRPLQTVLQLKKLRDAIAHGKPERRAGRVKHEEGTEARYPRFTLRSLFTPKEKMEKAVQDVEQLGNEIQKLARRKLKVEDPFFGKEAFRGPLSYSSRSTAEF